MIQCRYCMLRYDLKDVMPVDTAANMIITSVANGDRQLLMTPQVGIAFAYHKFAIHVHHHIVLLH
jgi:hypothetical protein